MQAQAQAIEAAARDLNAALGNLAPFAEDADELVDILRRQQARRAAAVSNTGVVFGALSERDGQLRVADQNPNRSSRTTAAATASCRQTFVALPTF